MKQSLREKFGTPFLLLLIALGSFVFISGDLHVDPSFGYLFPVNWLLIFPYGHIGMRFMNSFAVLEWWLFVEMGIMFFTWVTLFFIVRGFFYFLTAVEGLSMWQAFALCMGIGFLFFVLVLLPVVDQLEIWWEAWPEIQRPRLPGE